MTEQSSLTRADEIFNDMIRLTGSKKSVLLGNKCDLEHQVSDDDIAAIEKKYNTKYFDVSAKNGNNVEKAFKYILETILKDIVVEKNRTKNLINNDASTQDEKQRICCL